MIRDSIITSQLTAPTPSVSKLVFPAELLPKPPTCDNLLLRIKDVFKPPQCPPHDHPNVPVPVQVGALARVVRPDNADQGTFLRCEATDSRDERVFMKPFFEIMPTMHVRVMRLNAKGEDGHAYVQVPKQERFHLCNGQEGFVQCKYLVALPALPPCNAASVCLMRCVQRAAVHVSAYRARCDSAAKSWTGTRFRIY